MYDVKKRMKDKLLDRNILEPLVDKTFDEFKNKNGFIEKENFIPIINDIYRTLRLPPPSNLTIDMEFKRLNKRKDGKINKDNYRELIKDLIQVVINCL